MEGFRAGCALADRGYDSKACPEAARACGAEPVVPPRRNRLVQRGFDRHVCKRRHLVGNAFGKIKRWRGLATRYCKRTVGFEAAVQIRYITLWLHIL